MRTLAFLSGRGFLPGFLFGGFLLLFTASRLVFVGRFVFVSLFGILTDIFRHFQRTQHVADFAGKGVLIVHCGFEVIEAATRLILNEITPQVEHLACSLRWFFARQLFAHQHGNRFLQRRIFLT